MQKRNSILLHLILVIIVFVELTGRILDYGHLYLSTVSDHARTDSGEITVIIILFESVVSDCIHGRIGTLHILSETERCFYIRNNGRCVLFHQFKILGGVVHHQL